ncbi:MAG: PD-(D/E)XK nuclease family protein [Deltaproteobacteria bacterium]|nr:PD-(D/E)XK nuclease family protein [Deltaproteobacteria bacterium]
MISHDQNSSPRNHFSGELHISYSQLNTYLLCPMKYAHSYVYGSVPEHQPAALIFGRAIHRAVEQFYLYLKDTGERLPLVHLTDFFGYSCENGLRDMEIPIRFKEGENPDSLMSQGVNLLRIFYAEIEPQQIVAVEMPFSVPIPAVNGNSGEQPIKLVGYFDLVEADSEGTILIGELKTASQRFNALRLEHDLQSTIYSYASSRLNPDTPDGSCLVRFDVLLKTKEPAFERYFVSRSEADHNRILELINTVLHAIDGRIFYRSTGWQCTDCQFKKICLG